MPSEDRRRRVIRARASIRAIHGTGDDEASILARYEARMAIVAPSAGVPVTARVSRMDLE